MDMLRVASYDPEADVLYLNLKRGAQADDSEVTDDDIIIRYEKGMVIGLTVLHAKQRMRPKEEKQANRKRRAKKCTH